MAEVAGPSVGRTSGKATAGRLRMGPIVNTAQPQRATIPAKFETILNTGSRERDGFNRRTHRFDDPDDELPGPGAYHTLSPLIRDPSGEHTSKRGTAAFAFTEKRFYEAPRPTFVTPGPGKYVDTSEPPFRFLDTSKGISVKGTSSFALPASKAAVPRQQLQLPGPGQYDVAAMANAKAQAQSAIFKSQTNRTGFEQAAKVDVPGPGAYSDGLLKFNSVTQVADAIQSRPALVNNPLDPEHPRPAPPTTNAVFRSQTDRDGKRLPRDQFLDPLHLPPPPGKPPSLGCSVLREELSPNVADKPPRPSSVFAPTLLDRFGNLTTLHTPEPRGSPGPGEYGELPRKSKMLISSSWALSGVDRFDNNRDRYKPPGPAFYDPRPLSKSNFRDVSKRQWV
eukprot:GGOE01000306.1.p1 GENE.GGOE01000306.1~~GGOE01000306.1.p1  ORF type:complete len:394 (-),score=76.35 GGOE01000306.1:564-1745(-)